MRKRKDNLHVYCVLKIYIFVLVKIRNPLINKVRQSSDPGDIWTLKWRGSRYPGVMGVSRCKGPGGNNEINEPKQYRNILLPIIMFYSWYLFFIFYAFFSYHVSDRIKSETPLK